MKRIAAALVLALGACGDGELLYPYDNNTTVVIGPDGTSTAETPTGADCVDPMATNCIRPQETCGEGATADVLVDSEGAIIDVICYPEDDGGTPATVVDGQLVFSDNNVVAVFQPGELDGGVTIQGNNGVIYGGGPDDTTINGDVTLKGNNTIVRGIRVVGNVTFEGNNVKLFHCEVTGDVVIRGNNAFVSNCVVFGSIIYEGNNAQVITNLMEGGITFSGENNECRDNRFFRDSNSDQTLQSDERAAAEPLNC